MLRHNSVYTEYATFHIAYRRAYQEFGADEGHLGRLDDVRYVVEGFERVLDAKESKVRDQ
jgi:hypothetical protein